MQFSVGGFTWTATAATAAKPLPTRKEAIAELEAVSFPATNTRSYRQAIAAFSVKDYGQAIACCEAAREIGSAEYWS